MPKQITLVHRLAEQVQRAPEAIAIVSKERRVSYGELWLQVEALAGFLVERGLQPGQRVALCMENSPEFVVSYYGVAAAGGGIVALNSAAKAISLGSWLNHAGVSWLIADCRHPELRAVMDACSHPPALICMGEDPGHLQKFSPVGWDQIIKNPGRIAWDVIERAPDQLGQIIYTSGTTGEPKGVTLTHANLDNNVASILGYLKLSPADRVMNILPFYYSYGNSVLHTHLAAGATVVLEAGLTYLHQTLQKMVDERVTGFSGVPSTFSLLLSRVDFSQYDLSSLRYITQAGGAMSSAHIKRMLKHFPHAEFIVMYGQTEATARIAWLPPEQLIDKLGSAGKAIPNVAVKVCDEKGESLPEGVTGEIYVKGKNIMKGYWKNPEASARVLDNGWLKTGDMAYLDAEGFIYIVGRSSDIIKSGAHRISPKEIEEVILELDGVEEVAVVGVPDELLGELIKAVIVPQPGNALSRRDILRHCRQVLPLYKLPKEIEFVESLPKTASGKVKRFLIVENDKH